MKSKNNGTVKKILIWGFVANLFLGTLWTWFYFSIKEGQLIALTSFFAISNPAAYLLIPVVANPIYWAFFTGGDISMANVVRTFFIDLFVWTVVVAVIVLIYKLIRKAVK